MKDIKIVKSKNINLNSNKSVRKYNIFSAILFGFMTTSVMCYVFLISSSIFYAVEASQFEYKTEKIVGVIATSIDQKVDVKVHTDRISYINQDSDTAITLK